MILTAYQAFCIAFDAEAIKEFAELLEKDIEDTARNGRMYTCRYISWNVSDGAVEMLADEYRKRGFAVSVADRAETEHYTCDQYGNRSFRLDWSKAKEEKQ